MRPTAATIATVGFFLLTYTTRKNHYTQIQENPRILSGDTKCWIPNYMLQALYQHVLGYPELLNMASDIKWWDLIKSNINIAGRVSRVLRRE